MVNRYFPFVSLIILNWNGFEQTVEAIKSIRSQNYPTERFEIVVVDNGSEKSQILNLKSQSHNLNLKLILNQKNLGFAGGNNVAMRKILAGDKTEIIALINNDVVLDKNWLQRMVKPFDEKTVGITASTMIFAHDRLTIENTGHNLLPTGDITPRDRGEKIKNLKLKIKNSSSNDWVMGACSGAVCYRASMLRSIDVFYEDFFANYEDADLSLRAITMGWRCVYVPKAIAYHAHNSSIKKIRNREFMIRSQINQLKAFWYNVPTQVILVDLPFIGLREIAALVILAVTFQFDLMGILVSSRWRFLKDFKRTLRRRQKVQTARKLSVLWYYLRFQTWLPDDWLKQIAAVLTRKSALAITTADLSTKTRPGRTG